MIVKLKTKEELIEEFGFKKSFQNFIAPCPVKGHEHRRWVITNDMMKRAGETIQVLSIDECIDFKGEMKFYYTHRDVKKISSVYHRYWHESWFASDEYFKEDEFLL